jgi:pyruvate/2-oxoacid:ferredoxin oxidoreductase beta subunit
MDGLGFAIVEVLSNCPVGWGMDPVASVERLREVVADVYPPGVIVDRTASSAPRRPEPAAEA